MSKTKVTKAPTARKSAERLSPSFYETARKLKDIYAAPRESADLDNTVSELIGMAGWMVLHAPGGGQLAHDVYLAVGKAWKTARAEYGYENLSDPTERSIVQLHTDLRNAIASKIEGEPEPMPADLPAVLPPSIDNPGAPIDINLWRQSRPRPILTCAVDVRGGE